MAPMIPVRFELTILVLEQAKIFYTVCVTVCLLLFVLIDMLSHTEIVFSITPMKRRPGFSMCNI
jgi:hypothetical protein